MIGLGGSSHRGINCNEEEEEEEKKLLLEKSRLSREAALMADTRFINETATKRRRNESERELKERKKQKTNENSNLLERKLSFLIGFQFSF